jgi:hypothetical protein
LNALVRERGRMRTLAASVVLVVVGPLLALTAEPVAALAPSAVEGPDVAVPTTVVLRADPTQGPGRVVPGRPTRRGGALVAATSTINVTYSGFSAPAQAAFQHAADLLETVLVSPVPIEVDASFEALGGGTLGQAAPGVLRGPGSSGLPAGRFYPVALVNARSGTDICPPPNPGPNCLNTAFDIEATFASDEPSFYFGTDGNAPAGTYDFVTVVLHELMHGVGFLSSGYAVTGGSATRQLSMPIAYDFAVETGPGTTLASLPSPSAALRSALIGGDLWLDGPNVLTANFGNRARVHAPASFDPGSSISHLDEATYGPNNRNALMTPSLGAAQAAHDPGPIARAVLGEIGWTITKSRPSSSRLGDFDGDGDSDVIVFRPSNNVWYADGQIPIGYGETGDVPVPADYDGDGDTDVAMFRPSNRVWYVNGLEPVQYGAADDVMVPGDYDGDGDADVAMYRPTTGTWFVLGHPAVGYGSPGDVPVPADYDGDGDTDIAVFRPSTNVWFILGQPAVGYGAAGDVPEPADYDGDGDADVAVFRPSTNVWYVLGRPPVGYGEAGDLRVPADYDGDGDTDIAMFRPSNQVWYVLGQPAIGYGAAGDLPMQRHRLT